MAKIYKKDQMKKLVISFSGGRTSAYMTKMLLDSLDRSIYEIVVVFANTGKEREETLEFVHQCDIHMGFNTVWIEAVINPVRGEGTRARVVNYHTADRSGKVFEEMIKKYGIPNTSFLHCTRELKTNAITSYVRDQLGWSDYYTAIGIRSDEADRINPKHKKLRYIYPMITMFPTDKYGVNKFWINQSFDLRLKSYEGNCDLCYKKSDRKLLTLCREIPDHTKWWDEMGDKYSDFIPDGRTCNKTPVRFYRKNRSIKDLVELSKLDFVLARDESKIVKREMQMSFINDLDISNGCSESCEPF